MPIRAALRFIIVKADVKTTEGSLRFIVVHTNASGQLIALNQHLLLAAARLSDSLRATE